MDVNDQDDQNVKYYKDVEEDDHSGGQRVRSGNSLWLSVDPSWPDRTKVGENLRFLDLRMF